MDTAKPTGTNIESNGDTTSGFVKKESFGSKAKRHCTRFWWLWLVIFAIVILVVVLPIIYVGVPHKGQDELNKADVQVIRQEITDPQPNSFHLVLNNNVTSTSSYHPTLSSFNGSLFLEDSLPDIKPFGYITIPEVKSESEVQVDVEQDVEVADMDQFIAYNKLVISSEEFRLGLRGRPSVKLDGLPSFDVDYNKVVTMKGLNKLAGLAITSADIRTTPEPDGATLLGTLFIPNPSVLAVSMGNVTMDLSVNGTSIGYTLIPDLNLMPGNNTFNMRSYVDTKLVLGLVTKQYTDFVLPLDIIGNRSVNSAGERIPWLEAAIKENTIRYDLDLSTALGGGSS
ncbi:pre-mrna processing factor 4-like protein [Diplodia corticola]|uniref:Pre-mrna processing factor 4-like protein n=1 Tax=Diplodia corticola TaxID=236234 RepID=A0A1J9QLF7_9PEZI|nr:pre-mrna processing factor 4-like protein [Diplodia corticola]OJD29288.1 pre-mrna processing factor 4-like protein [Diplodia corticola]